MDSSQEKSPLDNSLPLSGAKRPASPSSLDLHEPKRPSGGYLSPNGPADSEMGSLVDSGFGSLSATSEVGYPGFLYMLMKHE